VSSLHCVGGLLYVLGAGDEAIEALIDVARAITTQRGRVVEGD
jgi:hypothetical protein